jgi:N6-adenosine-specific RNA methylase IME4
MGLFYFKEEDLDKIIKHEESELAFPSCDITATGLAMPENLSFEKWEQIGQTLRRIEGSRLWWFGDWCNFGEKKYGEKYSQALESGDYEHGTLRNASWVSSKVEMSHRCDNLSWSHHREVADLEPKDQDRWLARAAKEGISARDLRILVRSERMGRETPDLPKGKYRVFYADPPWKYADELIEGYGAAEHHYPTMTISELCALPILDLVEDNAVLFIWVTSPILSECWSIIKAWGFEYKASFVWDKIKHNFGHYNSVRHEFLLICTRGSCLPDEAKLIDSVQSIERMDQHSEKPKEFREMIDVLYAKGKRIELFARVEASGWERWGNELS